MDMAKLIDPEKWVDVIQKLIT